MYKGFCGRFQEDYKVYGQHLFYSVQTFIEITVKIVWRSSMLRAATAKNSKQMAWTHRWCYIIRITINEIEAAEDVNRVDLLTYQAD